MLGELRLFTLQKGIWNDSVNSSKVKSISKLMHLDKRSLSTWKAALESREYYYNEKLMLTICYDDKDCA